MAGSTVALILLFSGLMVVVSFLIGIWAKKKANTAQAYFGGTAMFGPLAVGLSSMAGIASAFALVGVPGIIYGTGNAMTFWMLSGAAFAMSYIIFWAKKCAPWLRWLPSPAWAISATSASTITV